ncbi:MAG: MFS transporter [Chloroflexota bacterium]
MNNIYRMTIISSLVFGAIGVSAPLMTIYLQELGASFSRISLILTSYAAILMVSNYAWGRLSDWIGRRKPLVVIGLFSVSIAFALLSRAPNDNWAWGIRILEGLSLAAYNTTSLALMGDLLASAGKRGQKIGIFRGIGSFAFAIGALLGGRIADAYTTGTALLFSAIFYLIAACVALTLHEERSASSPEKTVSEVNEKDTPKPLYQRPPAFFLLGVFLWTAAHGASASMWPNYMISLGYNKTVTSSLWALAAAVEGIGMPLVGILSDSIGRFPILVMGGIGIMLVQVGYITVARWIPALMGVHVVRGFGFASYTTGAMTFTAEIGDKKVRGNNSGTFYTASSTGQLFGSMLGGNLVDFAGFTILFSVCGVMAFLSAVSFGFLGKTHRKKLEANYNET